VSFDEVAIAADRVANILLALKAYTGQNQEKREKEEKDCK
jgi:hypothetical protein